MRNYELLCVLPGTLTEDELKPIVESVKEILNEKGAKDIVCVDMGKSRLAYPMKHIRYGYFEIFHFQSDPEKVQQIKKKMVMVQGLLRAVFSKHSDKGYENLTKKYSGNMQSFDTVSFIERYKEREKPEQKRRNGNNKKEKSNNVEENNQKKINLEEIDKNLDKILEKDIEKA